MTPGLMKPNGTSQDDCHPLRAGEYTLKMDYKARSCPASWVSMGIKLGIQQPHDIHEIRGPKVGYMDDIWGTLHNYSNQNSWWFL